MMNIRPVHWIESAAMARGLRYEPEADERWLRAWEPYATIRVAHSYTHALHATGDEGSLSLSRMSVHTAMGEAACWCAIVQDARMLGSVAITSDRHSPFGESADLMALPVRLTGDTLFDARFSVFAKDAAEVPHAITPSLRKLLMHWNTPLHLELRPGGCVLVPVAVRADAAGLNWILDAVKVLGDKAAKGRG
jgi:hypothetical protein